MRIKTEFIRTHSGPKPDSSGPTPDQNLNESGKVQKGPVSVRIKIVDNRTNQKTIKNCEPMKLKKNKKTIFIGPDQIFVVRTITLGPDVRKNVIRTVGYPSVTSAGPSVRIWSGFGVRVRIPGILRILCSSLGRANGT